MPRGPKPQPPLPDIRSSHAAVRVAALGPALMCGSVLAGRHRLLVDSSAHPRDDLPARPAGLTGGRGLAHSAAVSRGVDGLVRWGAQRRWPVLTTVAVVVACAAAVLQYAVPAAVPALERTPSGLARGEYWRLVTPLLVQTLGWYQMLADLATLAVIGAVTEWVLGWRWWLTLVISSVPDWPSRRRRLACGWYAGSILPAATGWRWPRPAWVPSAWRPCATCTARR